VFVCNSSSEEEEEEEEQIEPSDEDAPLVFKSDHEFSPESDVEDEEYQPTRRARTARKGDKGRDQKQLEAGEIVLILKQS